MANFTMTAENKKFIEKLLGAAVLLVIMGYMFQQCAMVIDYPINLLGLFLSGASLLALIWIFIATILIKTGKLPADEGGRKVDDLNSRHITVIIGTIVYGILVAMIGTYIATAIFVIATPLLLKFRNYRSIVITMVGALVFLYLINTYFRVNFP